MFDGQLIPLLSAGLLTTLTIGALKQFIRGRVVNDPDYEFPDYFYKVTLPFFTAVWTVVLGLVGWAPVVIVEPQLLVQWALTVVITLALYNTGIQPYRAVMKAR
ncbi:hypothetical protein LCGC14_0996020 [marine sediment metagenome]|uniref:Uncharacterized protein n=1 Tax=marine sediment metagenome TaxID=412755 RepID=A0A0F9N4G2_9ZZZZ